ncbi:MAG: PDZ domain-containing protein [Gemmatimonadales bacterium]|nr:PDZ domain-containing protein [Gemmatimonadales bacterium]
MLTLPFRHFTSLAVLLLLLVSIACLADDLAQGEPDNQDMRLLRFPDIHGDNVIFTYAGDLWTVSAQGGTAHRLTASIGYQSQPKFSPDGQAIAFSGNYDGNDDVYVIDAQGGEPVRLTWHPGWDRVIDWQPDGKSVRFQSPRRSMTGRDLQLYSVAVGGGLPEKIILPTAGLSSYSPDGNRIAYNRITREDRTWKRYKGGMAQDIWIYDFNKNDTQKMTDWIGSDNFPMWHGETLYYNSDQTGRLQIWALDLASSENPQPRQVTFHDEYDVKRPSMGPDAIVYENGGWLYVLNLATEQTRRLKIALHSDNIHTRPLIKKVGQMVRSAAISPDAKRVIVSARGDVFTVPAEKGNIRNLTTTTGILERDPVWSPDGKQVAYLSDRTGEYEIWLRSSDGKGEEKQLTKGTESWKFSLSWSPDSKHLLMNDARMNLWIVDAQSGKMKRIARSVSGEIHGFDWSPHSGWVAYSMGEENGFHSIFLYNVADDKSHRVTSDFTSDTAPCFDDEGNYLFFASGRHFNPTIGGFDLKPVWANMDGLYVLTLREDVENPFPPESDEVGTAEDDEKDEEENGDEGDNDNEEEKEDEKPIEIDLKGLADRMVELNVGPGNYSSLAFSGGKLFYMSRPFTPGGGRGNNQAVSSIKLFDMEEREEKTVLEKANGFDLAADGKKLLYADGNSFGIIDAEEDQKPAEDLLRIGEIQIRVDPRREWAQMFRDGWQQERDFFYDPGMHGVDWKHMYQRYAQLIPYVAHSLDFSYVIGELLGELNCSHSYVRTGDVPRPENIGTGLLGCDFSLDAKTGRYRFDRIFSDRDWNSGTETPLHVPGNEVAEGDYLLSVDGVELQAGMNPFSLFENKVGKQVVLKIAAKAGGKDSREITVEPVAHEFNLRYEAWVQDNRRKVDEWSNGKIGYLHMPNTAVGGQQGFAKGYYPNLRKEGLIIDERYNGGGFIPTFFFNILNQKLVNLWKPRHGQDWRAPGSTFAGHLAMVSNGYAGSGGDALPYYFKYYELGPVIGMRTWGGLVGYTRNIRLMDGGNLTFPEFGLFDMNGEWDVENYGVDPTIEVDNLPHEVILGKDPQLKKTVEYLLQKIADEPVEVPTIQKFPTDRN